MRLVLGSVVAVALVGVTIGSAEAFDPDRHEAIVHEALPFLRATVRDKIAKGDRSQDFGSEDKKAAAHHFDNCRFYGASVYVRHRYDNAFDYWLRAGERPRPLSAAYEFGRLLHPLQDFYSHSNWVDLRRRDLLDTTWGEFPVLRPWASIRPDVVVGENEHVPDGWTIPPVNVRFRPRVVLPGGAERYVLVTGISEFHGFPIDDHCHDKMTYTHDGELNKDNPDAPEGGYYPEARALAVRQTAFEWCRALQRARAAYGIQGTGALMGLWVRSGGSPHPADTPCRLRRGTAHWRVRVSDIVVRNTQDDDAGELNFSFALVDRALHDSARSKVGPMSIATDQRVLASRLPRQLEICSTAGRPPIVTLQGWDDDKGRSGELDIAPNTSDTDDVLNGVTLSRRLPPGKRKLVQVISKDVAVTFVIERLAGPQDPQPCTGVAQRAHGPRADGWRRATDVTRRAHVRTHR